ncbi:fluoride efflux transporter CrcB [Sphingomonas glacialis]|uniref:Fluoride-specific ion channel FluC n=1 Tax=Sphingomonas glacialis TaxID=658225 RepID=A0A502FZN6_9SPHN|nr:fluoride efflux transporter CrcB [Sphingomonas glacialis]TPG55117.1 fluoride efflux transporter CrcB [Sphingomonas glacialis]
MYHLILVMAGGALGSAARFLVGHATLARFGPDYPFGTLTVNIVGGFAMGLLAGILARHAASESWHLLLGVGVLGGFTTFSTFALDVVTLAQRGDMATALGYTLASVVGSIVAVFLGLSLTRVSA